MSLSLAGEFNNMPKKGYKPSKEVIEKRREGLKNFWRSPKGLLERQKVSGRLVRKTQVKGKTYEQLYGIEKAEETKRKIRDAQRGIPKSAEHNRKNSEVHKGKKRPPFSEEWRRKLGDATRGKTYEEIYGDMASAERRKRGEAHKGEKSHFWKNGISFEPYGLEFNEDLKEVIRNRDRRKCQMCEKTELENNQKLSIHHIDYDKKNNDPKNLITLCRSCHVKTNINRDYWINYFNNIKYER